ncbi:MAG: ATP-binding protein, partial [Candidatus Dormibacteraceae bacterium]
MPNPFHPSFGVSPPLLAGRDRLIREFMDGIDDGPGAAPRATLYTGPRGSGKTVLLNAIEDCVRERGWLVISETGTPGFVDRITAQRLPRMLREFDPNAVRRHLTGVTGPLGSGALTWTAVDAHLERAGLRTQLE